MFSKKSGLGTKLKNTTEQRTKNTTEQRMEIMGELLHMEQTDFEDEKKKHEILEKIAKIKSLNGVILNKKIPNENIHKQNQQSQKQIFNYQLYVIEKHFNIVPGTFATYEVNTNPLGIIEELLRKEDFKDAGKNNKILGKIEEIKELNKVILDNWDEEAPYEQLLKKMFNEQLSKIETHFGLEAGTFATYEVNTNPPPKTGGKSRRRRAKSSKRTKRSKARKSGKKSSKRSTRKTRRNRRSKH